jgi:hypothetical protein
MSQGFRRMAVGYRRVAGLSVDAGVLALVRPREILSIHGPDLIALTRTARLPVSEILIREAYRQYTPPVKAAAIVYKLLRTVPQKYLKGLDCVVLTNQTALSRKDRVGKVWSRGRKFDKSRSLGRYHPGSHSSLPYIELRVDKIVNVLKEAPAPLRIPFLRDVIFGQVLFHELGHHIHRTISPEHTEKEDVADRWAGKLNVNFIRKTYWYGVPLLRIYKFMRSKHWI